MKVGGGGGTRWQHRGTSKQGDQLKMAAMARLVARTLQDACQHVSAAPVSQRRAGGTRKTDLERLRSAIMRMVEALEMAANSDAFQSLDWGSVEDPSSGELLQRLDAALDQVELSARHRRPVLDEEARAALEAAQHPLEDEEAAQRLAWLARAQVAHQALTALAAHAQVDLKLAREALLKPELQTAAQPEVLAERLQTLLEAPSPDTQAHLSGEPLTPSERSPEESARSSSLGEGGARPIEGSSALSPEETGAEFETGAELETGSELDAASESTPSVEEDGSLEEGVVLLGPIRRRPPRG